MLAWVTLALAQAVPAAADTAKKPILDRYYECLVDQAIRLEKSGEDADIVSRAVVHSCRSMFAQASEKLRTAKADDARAAGLNPDDAAGFAARFRSYSHDYALTRVVNLRAWNAD